MRSSVTSTSLTPRNENSSLIKYFGGSLRSLPEDMTYRGVNRSVKENSANLHAFEIDANRLSRLKGSHIFSPIELWSGAGGNARWRGLLLKPTRDNMQRRGYLVC